MPKKNDPPEDKVILEIALKYYRDNLSQVDIAKISNMSQAEVSRHLKLAKEREIVQFQFDSLAGASLLDIKGLLKNRFPHLKHLEIVDGLKGKSSHEMLPILGKACAKEILKNLKPESTIGLSCGHSVNAVVNQIGVIGKTEELPTGIKIFSLVNYVMKEIADITPPKLVSQLSEYLPNSKGTAYQFPPIKTQGDKNPYLDFVDIRKFRDEEITNLDFYLVGLGAVNFSFDLEELGRKVIKSSSMIFSYNCSQLKILKELEDFQVKGECIHQPISGNDSFLNNEFKVYQEQLEKNYINLRLQTLRDIVKPRDEEPRDEEPRDEEPRVFAIAGGPSKHWPVLAGLRNCIFDSLTCDFGTAKFVAKQENLIPKKN
jgi:hypothetical protein